MIKIYLIDGTKDEWELEKECTHYDCRKELLFIFNGTRAVGMYNIAQIKKVIVK